NATSRAKIPHDAHRGVVPRRPDHRTRRMATRAARVKAGDRRRIRHALIKSKRVVYMMDMPVADPEMLLDLLGRQGKDIHHAAAEPRRKLLGDPDQLIHIARL